MLGSKKLFSKYTGTSAILMTRHISPTSDELTADLNGVTAFSKLDLKSRYNQLVLHPSCRYITTFSTHVGLYQYKRLSFGINSAAEIFQHENVSDDMVPWWQKPEQTRRLTQPNAPQTSRVRHHYQSDKMRVQKAKHRVLHLHILCWRSHCVNSRTSEINWLWTVTETSHSGTRESKCLRRYKPEPNR